MLSDFLRMPLRFIAHLSFVRNTPACVFHVALRPDIISIPSSILLADFIAN